MKPTAFHKSRHESGPGGLICCVAALLSTTSRSGKADLIVGSWRMFPERCILLSIYIPLVSAGGRNDPMEVDELFTESAPLRGAGPIRDAQSIGSLLSGLTRGGSSTGPSVAMARHQAVSSSFQPPPSSSLARPTMAEGSAAGRLTEGGWGALGSAFSGIASVGAAEGCWCVFVGNSILFLCDASTILLIGASVILVDISSRRETTDCLRA